VKKSALVLFAHGSRDPDWAAPLKRVQQNVAARKPALAVEIAYLELMEPRLPHIVSRLVDAGCQRITIAPIFIAQGAHLKRDLIRLTDTLRERHPDVDLVLLTAAGECDEVIDAMSTWLETAA
jgi:sirohydrochlorin cobaltochelatase